MSKQAKCHGLTTEYFNMVAPYKVGQESKDNPGKWHIVESKKILRTEKIWKEKYLIISKDHEASSPNTMDYNSNNSSYSDVVKKSTQNKNKDKTNFWGTHKSGNNENI